MDKKYRCHYLAMLGHEVPRTMSLASVGSSWRESNAELCVSGESGEVGETSEGGGCATGDGEEVACAGGGGGKEGEVKGAQDSDEPTKEEAQNVDELTSES